MTALERIKLVTNLVSRIATLEKSCPQAYTAFVVSIKATISDTVAARADGDLTPAELLTIVGDIGLALNTGATLAKAAIASK